MRLKKGEIMKALIKSIHLENFKGFKDKVIDFGGANLVTIGGRNASGKTTIATAFSWVLFDKDIDLNSNPNVKPLSVEECTPTVTLTLDVDGTEIELCKAQKIKTSKPDENGIVKSSIANTYSINSVPKAEKDFRAYLDKLGFPTPEKMLMMIHTDVFVGMKNADMRSALFDMVSEVTDKDLANKVNVPDLANLLDKYTLEEVQAMNKATIKKVNSQLEVIPGQIEGLELAKTDSTDTSEYELLVSALNKDIVQKQAEIDQIKEESSKYSNLLQEGMRLDFDRNSELERMNKLAMSGKDEIEKKLNDSANALVDVKRKINVISTDIKQTEQRIKIQKDSFENLKENYANAKALEFDESKTICPCCGQEYPEDKKAEIKAAFEKDKKSKMDSANLQGKTVQSEIKRLEGELATFNKAYESANCELQDVEKRNVELNQQLDSFKPSEVKETPELKAIDEKIAANKKAVEEIKSHGNDERLAKCNLEMTDMRNQLDDLNKKIGASSNNIRIDEQIEQLQNDQIQLEQNKADAEKILYQCEILAREKNNIVANEINSHFNLVQFQLWEMQKNGAIKDCCTPLDKDNKPLGVATNTSLEIMMKLDICLGFQKYYGVSLPVFIDNSESIDSDNTSKIQSDSQLILLKVTDGEFEVKGE